MGVTAGLGVGAFFSAVFGWDVLLGVFDGTTILL
jgi:hypothetical protein